MKLIQLPWASHSQALIVTSSSFIQICHQTRKFHLIEDSCIHHWVSNHKRIPKKGEQTKNEKQQTLHLQRSEHSFTSTHRGLIVTSSIFIQICHQTRKFHLIEDSCIHHWVSNHKRIPKKGNKQKMKNSKLCTCRGVSTK